MNLFVNEVYGMVDYFGWSLIQWRARFGESRDRVPIYLPFSDSTPILSRDSRVQPRPKS